MGDVHAMVSTYLPGKNNDLQLTIFQRQESTLKTIDSRAMAKVTLQLCKTKQIIEI